MLKLWLFVKADLAKAVTELDHLITLEKQNPYFWELKGQILLEQMRRITRGTQEGVFSLRKRDDADS